MPFAFAAAVLAAILGVLDAAATQPVFAFPLFIAVVVFAAVLAGVAVATSELFRQSRLVVAEAQEHVQDLTQSERRLRSTVESAEVGLGLVDLDGKLVQVSDRLAAILGRGRDELAQASLAELVAAEDRPAVTEGLTMLRNGDVARWSAELSDVALFLVRLPADPHLLVQATDIGARRRAQTLSDCLAAVREVIVASSGIDQAVPQVLRAFCERLGWSAGQFWSLDRERKTMRVRQSWNAADAPPKATASSAGCGRRAFSLRRRTSSTRPATSRSQPPASPSCAQRSPFPSSRVAR